MQRILLASGSTYRRQLLDKLGVPYQWAAPDIDETPIPGEHPLNLVQRLALNKALALSNDNRNALIIGSDQVAASGDAILGKPGNHRVAKSQLTALSGKTVTFFTGLALHNSERNNTQVCCETYVVEFRQLSEQQIENYLQREQPYDCAGSFKSEGLGISLFNRLEGRDPNALIGLPLIALVDMLHKEGVDILA